jgi:hypothetical protein
MGFIQFSFDDLCKLLLGDLDGVAIRIAHNDGSLYNAGRYEHRPGFPELHLGFCRAGPQELGLPVNEVIRLLP